jgi:hypothetical protein
MTPANAKTTSIFFSRLILTGLLVACWSAIAAAAPKGTFDKPLFDFGTVRQGAKVEHIFTINNTGDAPLVIKSVRPSCGCTAAAVSASVIPAGKRGAIKASFNSANFSGVVHKTVAVETNDPTAPSVTLTIKGMVQTELKVEPAQLNLGQVHTDAAVSSSILLTNRGDRTVRIKSVTSTLQTVTVTPGKTSLKPGESSTIHLTIHPRNGDRMLSGYIRLLTDVPERPELLVPIYGSLQNDRAGKNH